MFRELLAGRIVAVVSVDDERAVEAAIRVFREEFKVPTVLAGDIAIAKQAAALSKNGIQALLGPNFFANERSPSANASKVNLPVEVAVEAVPFAFQSKATTGSQQLPNAIAYSVYKGLGRQDALSGLTTFPASMFKLDSIGAIAVGKDADAVVLSGDPLDLATEVLAVVIDGVLVYEKNWVSQ